MYGSLVVGSSIAYTTSGWYYSGISMCRLGVSHPKDAIGGLKGGSPNESPSSELLPNESLGCPPSDG